MRDFLAGGDGLTWWCEIGCLDPQVVRDSARAGASVARIDGDDRHVQAALATVRDLELSPDSSFDCGA